MPRSSRWTGPGSCTTSWSCLVGDLGGASVELAQVAADVAAGRALASTDPTTAERVATQSLELLTRVSGHADDITLLAAQRVAAAKDFAVRSAASAEMLAEFRAGLAAWLGGLHVGPADAQALQHAVGELVINAVEHAYRDTAEPGPVSVTASLTRAGQVRVQVRDEGRWREPTVSTDRGRGLWMAGQLVDQLVIEHPGGATVAFVHHHLSRPARLLTTDTFTARAALAVEQRRSLVVEEAGAGRLRVAGPIDATTAADLAAALAHASAAGTRALTVDLSEVTHLASAGVSLLHEAVARAITNGVELRLYAPPGSPADQILTLVALPHTRDTDAGDDLSDPMGYVEAQPEP